MAIGKEWMPAKKMWELPGIRIESDYQIWKPFDVHHVTITTPEGLNFSVEKAYQKKERAIRPHYEGVLEVLAYLDEARMDPEEWKRLYASEVTHRRDYTARTADFESEVQAYIDAVAAIGDDRLGAITDLIFDEHERLKAESGKRPSELAWDRWMEDLRQRAREEARRKEEEQS